MYKDDIPVGHCMLTFNGLKSVSVQKSVNLMVCLDTQDL